MNVAAAHKFSTSPLFDASGSKIKPKENSLHKFFQSFSHFAILTWEKLKAFFVGESKDVKYLKNLSNQKSIDWKKEKQALAQLVCTVRPYGIGYHLLKALFKRCEEKPLKAILHCTFETMFRSSKTDYSRVMKFFDKKTLQSVGNFESLLKELKEMADCFPNPTNPIKEGACSELKKTCMVVIRFFPSLLDTILKAFNLIETGKGPESVWDFAAMIEIYFKIFMIPHAILTTVGVFVSLGWLVILITALVVIAGVIGICFYLKYRPCPSKLLRARNLSEEANQGKLLPVVGRDKEIQKIGSYLGKKKDGIFTNIILVGEPGVGKTELVKGVAQQFKDKKIFSLNAPELASSYSSPGDLMRLILLDIKGHEKEVVFFIDELGEAMKKNPKANFSGYLKPLLGADGMQVIAAATSEEYNQQILADSAFAERFTKIEIKPTTKSQTIEILQERITSKGQSIRFQGNIAEKIYTSTKKMLQPRNAVKLLNLAMNRVSAFDINKYVPEGLQEMQDTLHYKQKLYQNALNKGKKTKANIAKEIHMIKENIESLECEATLQRDLALKTRSLIATQNINVQNRNRLAKQNLAGKELFFLHAFLLPWMENKVGSLLKEIKQIPMTVNTKLINQILLETQILPAPTP